jgi:hypothetical protein
MQSRVSDLNLSKWQKALDLLNAISIMRLLARRIASAGKPAQEKYFGISVKRFQKALTEDSVNV